MNPRSMPSKTLLIPLLLLVVAAILGETPAAMMLALQRTWMYHKMERLCPHSLNYRKCVRTSRSYYFRQCSRVRTCQNMKRQSRGAAGGSRQSFARWARPYTRLSTSARRAGGRLWGYNHKIGEGGGYEGGGYNTCMTLSVQVQVVVLSMIDYERLNNLSLDFFVIFYIIAHNTHTLLDVVHDSTQEGLYAPSGKLYEMTMVITAKHKPTVVIEHWRLLTKAISLERVNPPNDSEAL